jgi:hypothetical protein
MERGGRRGTGAIKCRPLVSILPSNSELQRRENTISALSGHILYHNKNGTRSLYMRKYLFAKSIHRNSDPGKLGGTPKKEKFRHFRLEELLVLSGGLEAAPGDLKSLKGQCHKIVCFRFFT